MSKLEKPPIIDTGCQNIPVLSVSPTESDHADLERLLPPPQWSVYRADTATSALKLLQQLRPVPVVVCERDLLPTTWRDLFVQTALLATPPSFIVTSRLADDHLWAEALNIGAFDVLIKPFDAIELTRSLSLGWWNNERERATPAKLAIQ